MASRPAFTLVELLVVIGIIAVLAGILLPTISRMRIAGQEADTRSLLNSIEQACMAYYTANNAYPGPFSNAQLDATNQSTGLPIRANTSTGTIFNTGTVNTPGPSATVTAGRITATENLVLGLMGGLMLDRTNGNYYIDAATVGQGASSFNVVRPGRSNAFMQPTSLSKGLYDRDGATVAGDTIIPEFVDRFGTPMPVLYARSRNAGNHNTATAPNVETIVVGDAAAASDYSLLDFLPYTQFLSTAANPGGLRTADPAATMATKPFDAYAYLTDPATLGQTIRRARKKDSFVLISAGRDRVYGTPDDITNFGAVQP